MNKTIMRAATCALALILWAPTVDGRQLTADEALASISHTGMALPTRAKDLTPVYTAESDGMNVAYVFSDGQKGFIVAAADDILPPLLGYSTTSAFDAASIPPALEQWLKGYGLQLKYGMENGITALPPTRADVLETISPLCATQWNQGEPYNNDCPTVDNVKAPTGCTATAVAQVTKKHNWPVTGTGSHTYQCSEVKNPLTFNFGATTFDWKNMLNTYNSGKYTAEQAAAVSTLMAAVGNAACMSYDDDASGAYIYDALYGIVNYMKYDKGGYLADRAYYTKAEWENLIYSELQEGRPVVYAGYNSDGGHTFVVDGYAEGYYHLNWGWGGMSDGYFLLTALDPSQQGIGGSSSGYNTYQSALINVKPEAEGAEYRIIINQAGSLSTQRNFYSATDYIKFKVKAEWGDAYFDPFTLVDTSITMGVILTPESGGQGTFYPASTPTDLKQYYGKFSGHSAITSIAVKVSSLPAEGTYTARAAFKAGDKVTECRVATGFAPSVKIELSQSGASISEIPVTRTLSATDIKLGFPIYDDLDTYVTATITNKGEEYSGLIYPYLIDSNGKYVAYMEGISVYIPDGESVDVKITGEFECFEEDATLAVGNYTLSLYDKFGNPLQQQPIDVKVQMKPTGKAQIKVSYKPTGDVKGSGSQADPYLVNDTFPIELILETTSGLYNYKTYVYAYYADNNQAAYDYDLGGGSILSAPGYPYTLSLSMNTGLLPLNRLCYIHAYGYDPDWDENKVYGWVGDKIYVKRTTSGIEDMTATKSGIYPNPADDAVTVTANANINTIDIFSLSGTKMRSLHLNTGSSAEISVGDLTSGHYILVVTTSNGTERLRLIKK